MKYCILLIAFAIGSNCSSCSQTTTKKEVMVGGTCEGCEAIYESPESLQEIDAVDTLPDFNEPGPKIEISGIVYQANGRTPAKDVVLYVYHTDQTGIYPTKGDEKGWGKKHGYIRGWIKTGADGTYKFYTLVPASYPQGRNPKHIHPIIKEPGKSSYWIDEFLFKDDPYLSRQEKNKTDHRGSNGILLPVMKDGMLRATRDIILGENIPGYPAG